MKSLSFRDLLKVTGNFREVETASSSYRFFSKRQLVERALARIVQPSGSCNGDGSFVSWVVDHSGVGNVGRQTEQLCTPIPKESLRSGECRKEKQHLHSIYIYKCCQTGYTIVKRKKEVIQWLKSVCV